MKTSTILPQPSPNTTSSASPTTMKTANVLLIGSGRMGKIRAAALFANPKFRVLGVVDISKPDAVSIAEKYRFSVDGSTPTTWESIELAMEDPTTREICDGIVISTPTFTHGNIMRVGAEFGLKMFTEKPIEESGDAIKEIYKAVEEANIKTGLSSKICCGFQRRFDESYVAVKSMIKSNKIGSVVSCNVNFADNPTPPEEWLIKGGGDIFMDLAPHDVDFVRWCLEDEVSSVYATATSSSEALRSANVQDCATVVLKFSRGATCTLTMSRRSEAGYDQRCEFFGDKGSARVDNIHKNAGVLCDAEGQHKSALMYSFPERFRQAFEAEMDLFADVCLENRDWLVDENDCVQVQNVADAARNSFKTGEMVNINSA